MDRIELSCRAGDVAMWFMNGTTELSGPVLGNVPTSWTIQGVNAD
jgi:hypothetical protein